MWKVRNLRCPLKEFKDFKRNFYHFYLSLSLPSLVPLCRQNPIKGLVNHTHMLCITLPVCFCYITKLRNYFPTRQVRVVRFYVSSCPPPPRPPRRPHASSGWQCSPPDLNRELWLAVFPAGGGSVPRRTSSASSAWQRSPPDQTATHNH